MVSLFGSNPTNSIIQLLFVLLEIWFTIKSGRLRFRGTIIYGTLFNYFFFAGWNKRLKSNQGVKSNTQIFWNFQHIHCVKCVRISSFSSSYFPTFGLYTQRYSVFLCIQSKCEKIRTRKSPNADTFHVIIILAVYTNLVNIPWSWFSSF